ncbi:SctK family type III secretion system sorting platform protein [Pleionea sediminis]|uniref:SctK family type III secretion system sorting platform protein n=1 Tax=Pleionea sediminis TaxID=2569479 RepID=UPI0013DD965D|nr:SctK family type III secretion system sorting platform protein [Pleionea sediminis]
MMNGQSSSWVHPSWFNENYAKCNTKILNTPKAQIALKNDLSIKALPEEVLTFKYHSLLFATQDDLMKTLMTYGLCCYFQDIKNIVLRKEKKILQEFIAPWRMKIITHNLPLLVKKIPAEFSLCANTLPWKSLIQDPENFVNKISQEKHTSYLCRVLALLGLSLVYKAELLHQESGDNIKGKEVIRNWLHCLCLRLPKPSSDLCKILEKLLDDKSMDIEKSRGLPLLMDKMSRLLDLPC